MSRRAALTVVGSAILAGGMLSGCALVNPQVGPLSFGHDDPWGTNSLCAPDSHLDEPYFLGERIRNQTDEPITLTGIELVNPAGVELVAAGVAPVNPDAMGFMAGGRDLADPEMPWPHLSTDPLRYTLAPGEQVNLIVQIDQNHQARPATLDRLKLQYEAGHWVYSEFSGTDFQWVPTTSC